ncbi:phage tail protein [Escherichia coli]|uniref:phage tail protein n=1 Tax=Escherichia coli TaxID=562 RepID=UPI001CC0AF12|nr:phage tail protein [Escherichia coli]UAP28596.1 phage tail protein [Escherichia coli]UAP33375.1 phage tail protein [Escherichia coli]
MTAKYLAILTNQGAARLANAAALGTKLNLTQMAVGDANGTLPTPDPAQTKLINQKRIAPLNLLTVDPANTSQIIAEQIIPENEGGFWIREIGLYDDDGILIAVANCPETYKPQLQEGSGRTQTIRMILIVSSTSSITLKIDPSVVLATRKYADDKAIELKLYVDDLMSKHLAAADPHSQYATKDSPTFTGKPKAPTPPVVANDTQVATAGFVQAVIAALVSGELANKQPLDKTLTDLSGKDVAAILEYLGLGTAAKRAVGTGANQIPDMSSFQSILSTHGYQRLPGGIIIQWGLAPAPVGVASQKSYPITFPNAVWHVFMCHNVPNDPGGLGLSGASVVPGNSVFDYMIQAIKVSGTTVTATPAGTTNMGMHFFAIGY